MHLRSILALGVVLRLALALVNRDANDDHLAVISRIADSGRLPGLGDCWQCYHPKLYHLLCAALVRLLGLDSTEARTVLAQLVSVAFATGTLVLFARFLRQRARAGENEWAPRARVWGFLLVTLNPELVAIDVQATNDSAVIFFSTLALYCAWRFLRESTLGGAASAVGAAALAAIAKGSGLVTLALVFVALAARWRRHGAAVPVMMVAALPVVAVAGGYLANYRDAGSPFAINVPRDPRPPLVRNELPAHPGVTSIVNSYLTFRFWNLLEYPFNTQDNEWFPVHRTSLWTQLYGRLHFAHFPQWPPSWATRDPWVLDVGRATLVLALLPSALALAGFGRGLRELVRAALRRDAAGGEWLFPLVGLAFLAMILKLTLDYRCYCTMKPVYLFPGMLAGLVFLIDGLELAWARLGRARVILGPWLGALAALYLLDLVVLARQLGASG